MFLVQFDGLLAMGVTAQTVQIDGSTTTTVPGGMTSVAPGGLLARDSNGGLHRRDRFSVVPQGCLKLACYLSGNVQVSVGYNFLYWTGVARPGDQVDLGVNPATRAGPSRPAFALKDGDLWAQGLTFALEFSY
jgi:hypothetical protein